MIYTDSRGDGEKQIASLLQSKHIPVEIKFLESSDYLIPLDTDFLAIERKTVNDLVCSVIGDNRHLYKQLEVMKNTYKKCLVIVEGNLDADKKYEKIIQGILYSIMIGWQIPVINTLDKEDTAKELAKLFDKYGSSRISKIPPAYVIKAKSTKEIKHGMLQVIDGVGPVLASKILKKEPLIIGCSYSYEHISNSLSEMVNLSDKVRNRLLNTLFNLE
jgi:Fanconi anemia group M protein